MVIYALENGKKLKYEFSNQNQNVYKYRVRHNKWIYYKN